MVSQFKYPFPVSYNKWKDLIYDVVEKNWNLNRTAVNQDTDKLVKYLNENAYEHAEIHQFQAASECLTWTIPHHWHVREAYIETMSGKRIVDYSDNALHLWSHSIPVDDVFAIDELKNHIITDENRPDEFKYHYRLGYRSEEKGFGFSIPYRTFSQMNDSKYRVHIDADLDTNGTMKVVDIKLPGESTDTIFFMAHTCHPWLVNDGLSCIAIAMALFNLLKEKSARKYTYRFIFGPEYFASAGMLSKLDDGELKKLKFGCYLDMLGNHEPMGFQRSFQGDSLFDKVIGRLCQSKSA